MNRKRQICLAGAAVIFIAQAGIADTTSDDAALNRIKQLENTVAKLQAQNDDNWMTETRAAEIRSLVQDVLNDADSRSSLLQGGGAGWDKGFYLASSDGNFKLALKGVIQFRYAISVQDDQPGLDSTRGGFENRRTALKFGGHVVDPSWKYFIQGMFNFSTGGMGLLDAFVVKDLDNGWNVRAGKFRMPFMREQIVNYTALQPVERSLISSTWGIGRSQGVELAYKGEDFRFAAAFHDDIDGIGGITGAALAYDTEYAFTARLEGRLAGTWKQFNDFSGWQSDEFGFLLGGAIHWEDGEYGTAAVETEIFRWTIDGQLDFSGASIYAAVVGNHTDVNGMAGGGVDQYGALIQGGFFVTDDWELFARYEWGDDDMATDDLSLMTIGAIKYWSGHQLKWTTDVGVGFNGVSGTFDNMGANWREDLADDDGQVVVRSQLQLMF